MNTEDTRTTGLDVVTKKLIAQEEENERLRGIVQRAREFIRKLYDEGAVPHDVALKLRKALKP